MCCDGGVRTIPPIASLTSAVVLGVATLSFAAPAGLAAPTPTPKPVVTPTPTVPQSSTPGAPTCAQIGDNILLGDPLYREALDPDHDGLACETGAAATPQQAKLDCSMLGARVAKSSWLYRDYLDADKDGMACEAEDYPSGHPVDARAGGGPNCAEVGRTNIPVDDPQYAPKLDRDLDGIGCEDNGEDGPLTTATAPAAGVPAGEKVRGLPATGW